MPPAAAGAMSGPWRVGDDSILLGKRAAPMSFELLFAPPSQDGRRLNRLGG
jgi:hypothetical protein